MQRAIPKRDGHSARQQWTAPQIRRLAASLAENGPIFPTADGVEGHS